MPKKFHKYKLLLDENMPARTKFSRLNSRYDLKHIRDDLHVTGMLDPQVYEFIQRKHRLILTFNGDDSKDFAGKSKATGILFISDNLTDERIDTKLMLFSQKILPTRSTAN
jgi:hypothetical protein